MVIRIAPLIAMIVGSGLIVAGCLDPYSPRLSADEVNILVVDGSIDASEGSASVRLSRGLPVSASEDFPTVDNAVVTIEDAAGNNYVLDDLDSGRYATNGIVVYPDVRYRLHVLVGSKDEYYSDFVSPLPTPEIDSITYITDPEKLTIRVNTHNDNAQSRYYRWTFEETWNYHAWILSTYLVQGNMLRLRTPEEMAFYCWKTLPSYDILAGSTKRLAQNIVSQFPVQYIPAGSLKLQMRYSMLLKQMSISEDEYTYLEQLKKTTESLGGLFDPMPGSVTGNVHRVLTTSPLAVGYFSAGYSTSTRIYINGSDLPKQFREIWPPQGCLPPDTICFAPGPGCSLTVSDLNDSFVIGTPNAKGYSLTSTRCSDCRYNGGITTPPDWWQ